MVVCVCVWVRFVVYAFILMLGISLMIFQRPLPMPSFVRVCVCKAWICCHEVEFHSKRSQMNVDLGMHACVCVCLLASGKTAHMGIISMNNRISFLWCVFNMTLGKWVCVCCYHFAYVYYKSCTCIYTRVCVCVLSVCAYKIFCQNCGCVKIAHKNSIVTNH